MNFRVGIIGGGAAGMMAALAVKEVCPSATVLLFEKNSYLGAKSS
jgi:predicted flavoprotein YhiN